LGRRLVRRQSRTDAGPRNGGPMVRTDGSDSPHPSVGCISARFVAPGKATARQGPEDGTVLPWPMHRACLPGTWSVAAGRETREMDGLRTNADVSVLGSPGREGQLPAGAQGSSGWPGTTLCPTATSGPHGCRQGSKYRGGVACRQGPQVPGPMYREGQAQAARRIGKGSRGSRAPKPTTWEDVRQLVHDRPRFLHPLVTPSRLPMLRRPCSTLRCIASVVVRRGANAGQGRMAERGLRFRGPGRSSTACRRQRLVLGRAVSGGDERWLGR
jgi:hypothetical protein